MPLPNIKKQCTALNRTTGHRCKNPAAFGCKTCRYHGARRQVPSGEVHPNYRHGQRTKESVREYRTKMVKLEEVESIARSVGLLAGPRRRRRKPICDEHNKVC
jgi:hypothetical protein